VSSGGLGLAALRYAESVSHAGAEVTLLTAARSDEALLRPAFVSASFKLIHFPSHSGALRNLVEQYNLIGALCEQTRFDLVHLHGVWLPLFCVAGFVARRHKIPYVVSPHGCFEPWALNHKRLKKAFALMTYQGWVNRGAAMFFATAGQEVDSIRHLRLAQPVAMIPNGVDLGEAAARTLHDGKRTILFLSRIHPKKGLLDLVNAWVNVRDPNWRIVIAGPDENGHQAEVQAAIKARGLESDFDFLGLVSGERKSACFANADVFVLPTYSENFGIAVAEALANELPVITTTGAPWKSLVDYRCGWWVEPGVAGISSALQSAMTTPPKELESMGKRGRLLVADKCSWSKIGCDALKTYEWMLGSKVSKPEFVDTKRTIF